MAFKGFKSDGWDDAVERASEEQDLATLLTLFALRSARCSASHAGHLDLDWFGSSCKSGESWLPFPALRHYSTVATTVNMKAIMTISLDEMTECGETEMTDLQVHFQWS